MAESDKIKASDIIQEDIFKNTIESGSSLVKVLKSIEDQFKSNLDIQEKYLKSAGKKMSSADDITKTNAAIKESTETRKKLNKVEQERIKLEEKLVQLSSSEAKENARLREEIKKKTLEQRQSIQETTKELGAYKNLSAQLNRLKREYKDLAVTEGESTKKSRELLQQITLLDQKLKQVDRAAGEFGRNVGNYPKVFSVAGATLKNFVGAFGVTAGITGFANLLKNVVSTFSDFEQANVELAGVLGKTTDETTQLTEQAKELGATTSFTATEVLRLQEAYARLGFSQQEIIDLTPATIDGAVALRATAAETAELVGAVVRSFDDFETVDAPDIIDQLTLATQKSALNFEKLQTSLPIVSGAANAAGIPFTKLVALLGKLSDAGIDASSSATALRNIFIDSSSSGKSYEEILETLKNSTDKLTGATDEFGKRTAVSASILSNQLSQIDELDKTLQNAGGTAKTVAEQNLDTLQGSVKLLSSAWEGFVLSIESGDGAIGQLLKSVVDLTAKILSWLTVTNKAKKEAKETGKEIQEAGFSFSELVKFIGIAVTSWAAYRTTLLAANAITAISTTLQGALTTAINGATIAQRAFNVVTKANPIGLLVSALAAAASALFLFREDTEEATKSTEEFNAAEDEKLRILKEQEKILVDRRKVFKDILLNDAKNLRGYSDAVLEVALEEAYLQKAKQKTADQIQVAEKIIKAIENEIEGRRNRNKKSTDGATDSNNKYAESIKFVKESLQDLDEQIQIAVGNISDIPDIDLVTTEDVEEIEDNIKTVTEIYQEAYKQIELDGIRSKKSQEDIQKEQLNLTIAYLQDQIKVRKAAGIETLDLELELAKAQQQLYKQNQQEIIDIIKQTTELTANVLNELQTQLEQSFEQVNNSLEAQIEQRESNIDKQRELASKGLENTLQFEEKKLAEARIRQQQELERQQKIEEAIRLTQAYFAAFQARVDENPDQAPFLALKDVALAKGIATGIKSLVGYFDGTEDTGSGGGVDDRGGFLSVLHPHERVMTKAQNSKVGSLSNDELANIAMMYNKGQLVNPFTDMAINVINKDKVKDNTHLLINEISMLRRDINSKPVQMVNVDSLGNLVEVIYRNGIKETIKHKRNWL